MNTILALLTMAILIPWAAPLYDKMIKFWETTRPFSWYVKYVDWVIDRTVKD